MQGKPVTIRTLDIGADKSLDTEQAVATNPALGLLAIRYCLAHPDLFHTQLRALWRAAQHGPLRVLIPMVSNMAEVRATQSALERAKQSLLDEGVALPNGLELGAMRSEEHTSELQSRGHLVCRLLLEKKKKIQYRSLYH